MYEVAVTYLCTDEDLAERRAEHCAPKLANYLDSQWCVLYALATQLFSHGLFLLKHQIILNRISHTTCFMKCSLHLLIYRPHVYYDQILVILQKFS